MVLHKLAEVLHELNEKVVLVTPVSEGQKPYPVVLESAVLTSNEWALTEADWVVYPEIVDGNPLKAFNVVRWLLNVPGDRGGNMMYGEKDLFFHFSNNFLPNGIVSSGLLKVRDYGLEFFRSEKRARFGVSIMIRKSRSYRQSHFLERLGWPVVDFLSGLDRKVLNRYFNSLAVFVSYDTETYHSVQAALSGSLSIVVPREGRSRLDFYNHGAFRYGVAYGMKGIPWALWTRGRMRDYLIEENVKDKETVTHFVKCLREQN